MRPGSQKLDSPWAQLPLWLLLLVVPLVVDPVGKDAFRLPKLFVAEILALLSLLGLAWSLKARKGAVELRALLGSPGSRIGSILLVATAVSAMVSLDPWVSARSWLHLAIGVTCLWAWSLGWKAARLRRWLDWLVLPAAVLSMIAILQFHDLWEPLSYRPGEGEGRLGITSLAGASGDLAAFLVLPLLVVQLRMWEDRKWMRWIAVLGLLTYGLLTTQNLTGLVAGLIGSIVLWAGLVSRRRLVTVIAGALLVVSVASVGFSPLRDRVSDLASSVREGRINALLSGRLDGWRVASRMWQERPVTGVGPGAFRSQFGRTKLAMAEEGTPFFQGHQFASFDAAHNEYLQVAAEMGTVGVLALLSALILLIREMMAWPTGTRRERADRAFAWAGSLAFALLSFAYFPWHLALTAYPGVLFLAWVLSAGSGSRD